MSYLMFPQKKRQGKFRIRHPPGIGYGSFSGPVRIIFHKQNLLVAIQKKHKNKKTCLQNNRKRRKIMIQS